MNNWMNKRFALALTLLLGASLSFAQANGGSDSKTVPDNKKTTGKATSAQSKVALNPQPEPPGARKAGGDPNASKVSLNPQPLPPGERKAGGDPASKVSLNPQPLPPKQGTGTSTSAGSKVALNPQPLPPGAQSNKTTAVKGKDNKKGSTPATGSPKQ